MNTNREILRAIAAGERLTEAEAKGLMDCVMAGELDDASFGAIFSLLHQRGESVDELVGFARSMRKHMVPVSAPLGAIDTCGTGGDGADTFNVSTCAAFVVAGAGIVVAKHGNRAVSSKCGSADVLEALGGSLVADTQAVHRTLEKSRFCFLFAPAFHPSMRHAARPRRSMAIRTAFNFLGPIVNPASITRQVIGVSDQAMADRIARVVQRLGCEHALIVYGSDGLDELTITGRSQVVDVTQARITRYEIDPATLGLNYSTLQSIRGGTASKNALILQEVLEGKRSSARDIVLLNAAAGIYVSGKSDEFASALDLAREAIDSGSALNQLRAWVDVTKTQARAA